MAGFFLRILFFPLAYYAFFSMSHNTYDHDWTYCKILMVDRHFTFFDFQVLRFERSGGFGRYSPPYLGWGEVASHEDSTFCKAK